MCKNIIFLSLLAVCFLGCQSKSDVTRTQPHAVEPVSQSASQVLSDTRKSIEPMVKAPALKLKEIGEVAPEEKETLRGVFASFKTAVLSYKGEEAAAMMSESSLEYYENLLTGVRMSVFQPEEFKVIEPRLSPTNRATIQIMAERLSASFIAKANAQKLYETAFKQGWIGYKTLQTASVDYMRLFDDNGKRYVMADFYYAGTLKDKNLNQIGFVYENGGWKIDLVPLFLILDENIQKAMKEKHLDTDLSIDMTVDGTREALEPNAWKLAKYDKDNFIAGFPRAPLFTDDNGQHIYTSQHHIYGQFDVRVSYYDGTNPGSPYQVKAARDQVILGFLNPLGVKSPQCMQKVIENDIMIKCDFTMNEPPSQGKSVWFFTKDRVYHLFNLARADKYNDEAAAVFMQRFAYGMSN